MKYHIILTVVFENHHIFYENYNAIISQNSNAKFKFIVIDNSSKPDTFYVDFFLKNSNIEYINSVSFPISKLKSNSFHHAFALDYGVRVIQKKFKKIESLIVIDPDYFVFGNDWISILSEYVTKNDYYFIGSPWASKWTHKYKNFPCVQCMIIRGDLISKLPSFTPINYNNKPLYYFWKIVYSNRYLQFLSKFLVNHVFDTGSQIYNKYQKKLNITFKELTFSELLQTEFFSKFKKYEFILDKIIQIPNEVELFKYKDIFTVHFRTFGNSILKNNNLTK